MALDFDRTPWQLIHPDLAIYRYQGNPDGWIGSQTPILMLHGPMTSHRTWDTMAYHLWEQGFRDLYALDIADIQMGGSLRAATKYVEMVLEWMSHYYPPHIQFALIGHSTGGVLARRVLSKTPHAERIAMVFTLGSPHSLTHFSYQVYVPEDNTPLETGETNITRSLVKTPQLSQKTFIINIFGDAVGANFDGTVHGVYLPEGVNVVRRLAHAELKHHPEVIAEILACLRGERYRMQFFLQTLHMKTPDQEDGKVGPFYFEVNGMRSPYTGIFQAAADHHYSFDETSTPLATLSFPTSQNLTITVFRLKDVSRTRAVRRRLFAKLMDTLSHERVSVHELQDSEGSLISLCVTTHQMPRLLEDAPK